MTRFIALIVCVSLCQIASADNPYGIKLNPGETLVSVNGVPVNQGYSTSTTATVAAKPVTSQYSTSTTGGSMYSGSDQERAQAEANYMAQHGITGHVGATIGRFEGCGWSSSGTPPTCTPSYSMTLTADAIAHGPGGVYRVRAWR